MDDRRPTRVALYARCSTEKQGHSTSTQVFDLREYAERRGLTIVREYVDEAVSGARDSRPALNEMLADARRGRFDLVLVVRLDRLGRNLRHLLTVLEELSEHGVAFASATEPIDTSSPAGRMVVAVLGAAAELERSLLRERTKAGLASARRRGKKLGRPRVAVDIYKAEALVRAGQSLRQIAKQLGVGRTTIARALAANGGWPKNVSASGGGKPRKIAVMAAAVGRP